jgi:hypothetical protein
MSENMKKRLLFALLVLTAMAASARCQDNMAPEDAQAKQLFVLHTSANSCQDADHRASFKNVKTASAWVDIVKNGDLESDDVSCFFTRDVTTGDNIVHSTIVDGAGKNDSHGIVVQSADNPEAFFDTEFFLRLPQPLPAGTSYRLSFDCKASQEASCSTNFHAEPSHYITYEAIGNVTFTTQWKTHSVEGVLTTKQSPSATPMRTIAFNLSEVKTATTYYFDNFVLEIDGAHYMKLGDVNGDDNVTPADAIMILYRYFGVEQTGFNVAAADINGDGNITPADAIEALYIYFAGSSGSKARATRPATGSSRNPE